MTLNELLDELRDMGVDQNTLQFAENCYNLGREQGIKQERAMWELSRLNQEIEGTSK